MHASIAVARLETVQGFALARLSNASVSITVVPALGAKLLSLCSLLTGREWLWRPADDDHLFASQWGDDFVSGTLTGADECLPTIGACRVGGRTLPDHGEVWSQPWTLDEPALERGVIRTSIRLKGSPLWFAREVRLEGPAVTLDYTLRNESAVDEPFLWALHPLLTFCVGDRLSLPEEVRTVRVESARQPEAPKGTRWSWPRPGPGVDLSDLRLGGSTAFAKFFAGPLTTGVATITNSHTGDGLRFRWSSQENPYVGIWLTRGGWRGAHHPAIEPTNAPFDTLSDALREPNPALFIESGKTRRWRVVLDVGPGLP